MSEYRRLYQPGGHYFFTLVTYERRPIFNLPDNIAHLKSAIKKVKQERPFALDAIVILPDHLHCLWRLPENDNDFSTRWRLIKRYVSMSIKTSVNERKEKQVWQRRYWEHFIRSEDDLKKHLDYIHYNPVKHGLAESPLDWQHSTFRRYLDKGFYEEGWGVNKPVVISGVGGDA